MRRVSAYERMPVTKLIRDQTTPNKILLREDLVAEIRSYTEYGADCPIAVY